MVLCASQSHLAFGARAISAVVGDGHGEIRQDVARESRIFVPVTTNDGNVLQQDGITTILFMESKKWPMKLYSDMGSMPAFFA
jgi:hypothetical protein